MTVMTATLDPGSGPAGSRGGSAAAAVGPGDDLQQVAVGIVEVQAAAAVTVADLPPPGLARIRPVRQILLADAAERGVELLLAHEERVMLGRYLLVGLGEVQRDAVVRLDHQEVPEAGRRGQAEDPGEERRRPLLVAARHNSVVQLHAHGHDSARSAGPRTSRRSPCPPAALTRHGRAACKTE